MSVDDILKRIDAEAKKVGTEELNMEGLVRLQDAMKGYDGDFRLVLSTDLLKEILERPKVSLHPTKLKVLDDIIGGFRDQQLITIAGHTGHGKTQFGLFLVDVLPELKPVVVPMEQSAEEIIEQRHANGYSVPLFFTPYRLADKKTVDWIEERVVEGIAKHNTKLVLIDHLGYIKDDKNPRENLAYRIGEITRGLKNIAKKWNVIVVLLVHISQKDETKPPTMEDIKNSSDISQESDLVLTIWRKTTMKKKVIVREEKVMIGVHKNRRTGKTGTAGLAFRDGVYHEDNAWVDAMVRTAEAEIEADDAFENL